MRLPAKNVKKLQDEILTWYAKNQRDLPWRKTADPYKIFVSEIMLQQTQVSRVISKYEAWLYAFPDIESLAQAKKEDILRLWSGLGYNRRALYLQKTAIQVRTLGKWPETVEGLEKLPGVGAYTARAIACFAFAQQVAVVDANVRKVILLKVSQKQKEIPTKELQEIADQLLPKGRAYDWNQALMDYSSVILQKKKVLIPKQTKFIGSHRYYRGKVLRLLLEHKTISIHKLGSLLKDNYSQKDRIWQIALLSDLEREGMVQIVNDVVRIA